MLWFVINRFKSTQNGHKIEGDAGYTSNRPQSNEKIIQEYLEGSI